MHLYRVAGLSVASEVALPGLIQADANARAPDVSILRRPVPASLENASAAGPTWQIAQGKFLLRIPDIARFLLIEGREITFELENDTPLEEVAIFLIGTVLGILLHQRGQIVLHASAVRVGSKAVLFCGPSGAGKSTIAAALGREGFPLVADDVCALAFNGKGPPMVQPDGRQLKLWTQAIDKLELGDSRGPRVRSRLEKYFVDPRETCGDPLPLGAVYVLRETRPPHVSGIERPNVVDCALLLRHNAYRPLLVRRMDQKEVYFRAATKMINAAGLFHLTRALDFTQMPMVLSQLREHWAEIGVEKITAV